MKRAMLIVGLLLILIPVDAVAQQAPSSDQAPAADETVFDFEVMNLDGQRLRPMGTNVQGGGNDRILDLLRVRQDFVDVLMRSVEVI